MRNKRAIMSTATYSMADYLKTRIEAYKLLSHSKIIENIVFNHIEKRINLNKKPLNNLEDSKEEMGS